jgi:LPS export ABC transporter protein LptC
MKFINSQLLLIMTLALTLLLAMGCSGKKEIIPVSRVSVKTPYQELDSTTMVSYNGSKKTWILESDHIVKVLADTGHIRGAPVKITVFDSLGKQTSKVLSDSGMADALMQEFIVWGNVFVKAENGVRVKTQKLAWNQKTHRVTSDTYVQLITQKGDVLRGKGLDAAEDFSSWRFLHDVSGRFPNFRERVDKGGEF